MTSTVWEEAHSSAPYVAPEEPPLEATMAGVLKGEVVVHDDNLEVFPDVCPVEDVHRLHNPRCFATYPDGEYRACPYWIACTSPGNCAKREHPTVLRLKAISLGARRVNCQILCQAARRNRPPGA